MAGFFLHEAAKFVCHSCSRIPYWQYRLFSFLSWGSKLKLPSVPPPPASINMIVVYLQDFSSGINATNVMVSGIQRRPYDLLLYGLVDIVDDNMTTTIDRNWIFLAKAQGTLITAAFDGSQVTLMFVFAGGLYTSGTLVMLGISEQIAPLRKVSIIGGTGPLLYATRYAMFETAFLQQPYTVIKATPYFKSVG